MFSGKPWAISCFESHLWKYVGAPWSVITFMRLHAWDMGWVAWGGGAEMYRVPCELVSEPLPSFDAERHREGNPTVPWTLNVFKGSFRCALAVILCFSPFSLYHKHSKDGVFLCTGFQPELDLSMQECHLQEHQGVLSLPACFIVTKESEPLLRRLYAARSSAFPSVSCAHLPCSRIS